eukprot:2415548-Pyramimonas_sp.AAC.1
MEHQANNHGSVRYGEHAGKEAWRKDNEYHYYSGDAGKGNKGLSLNFRLDLPALPPAYQTSMTKVHGAKCRCSLVY